jgi:tetratricopeptide (TPR) repeat protein
VFLLERSHGGQQVTVQQLSFSPKAWKIYRKAQDKQGKGKIEEAEKLLAQALEVDPEFTWALNDLGVLAFQTGRFEKAKGHFLAARGTDSRAYPPLVNLGGVLVTLREYEEAIQINQEANKARPDDPLALSQLGLAYMGLREDTKAISYLEQAKQLEPGHFSYPQLALAQLYFRNGNEQAATEEWEEFVRLHPDSPRATQIRAKLSSPPKTP